MQNPPPPPPSEIAIFTWKMRNVLKRKKNQFSDFYFWSYDQFCTQNSQKNQSVLTWSTFQKSQFIVPKDRQCSETNAEPNFRFERFLVFEIWPILYSKFLVNWWLRRLCASTVWEHDSETLTSGIR